MVRAARVVLSKAHEKGHLIADLVEPYIKPPPMATSFPCAPNKLESWLVEVSEGEHGGEFHMCNGNRIFSEWDTEDIAFSASRSSALHHRVRRLRA